jgi:UDP-N-acetylglucosamine acyltransferase
MIHPSSVIAPGAQIAEDVEIGPLCYIGPNVKIGPGCKFISHCNIDGYTTIGSNNVFHPFSAIGQPGQDRGVEPGSVSYVTIGDNNIFRENTTVHSGTKPGTVTQIGSNCMFMAGSHVAHNCKVGNNVIIVNASVLGGYSEVGDNALISGLCAVHQFCRVGRFAMISGVSAMSKDVPPFMTAEGRNGGVKMVNLVGLKRAGFSDETIRIIRNMHKLFYRSELSPTNAIKQIKEEFPQIPEVLEFIEFYETSKKGVLAGKVDGHRS